MKNRFASVILYLGVMLASLCIIDPVLRGLTRCDISPEEKKYFQKNGELRFETNIYPEIKNKIEFIEAKIKSKIKTDTSFKIFIDNYFDAISMQKYIGLLVQNFPEYHFNYEFTQDYKSFIPINLTIRRINCSSPNK